MVRAPGAKPQKKISEEQFTRYMTNIRRKSLRTATKNLRTDLGPISGHLAAVGGSGAALAGTAAASRKEDSKLKKAVVPVAVGTGAVGALYGPRLVKGIYESAPNIAANARVAAEQISVGLGRGMALGKSKVGRFIGKRLIGLH